MTTGEGGIVVTNDDAIARRMYLFINKAWGYGDENPDHYFASLNYRMTELQAAVAYEQLKKLDYSVSQRQKMARLLDEKIADIDGIESYKPADGSTMTYWKFCLRVDDDKNRRRRSRSCKSVESLRCRSPRRVMSSNRLTNVWFSAIKIRSAIRITRLIWRVPKQLITTTTIFKARSKVCTTFSFCRSTNDTQKNTSNF